jgi:hypothetical protein
MWDPLAAPCYTILCRMSIQFRIPNIKGSNLGLETYSVRSFSLIFITPSGESWDSLNKVITVTGWKKSCNPVKVYRRFGGTYFPYRQGGIVDQATNKKQVQRTTYRGLQGSLRKTNRSKGRGCRYWPVTSSNLPRLCSAESCTLEIKIDKPNRANYIQS